MLYFILMFILMLYFILIPPEKDINKEKIDINKEKMIELDIHAAIMIDDLFLNTFLPLDAIKYTMGFSDSIGNDVANALYANKYPLSVCRVAEQEFGRLTGILTGSQLNEKHFCNIENEKEKSFKEIENEAISYFATNEDCEPNIDNIEETEITIIQHVNLDTNECSPCDTGTIPFIVSCFFNVEKFLKDFAVNIQNTEEYFKEHPEMINSYKTAYEKQLEYYKKRTA